tara:strand:+ start:229 stop:789 length:561 start_codon:yes stop_codon:yes gene_type:complete
MTTTENSIQVWDLLINGKLDTRVYFDPARDEYMRVTVSISGEAISLWESPEAVGLQFGDTNFAGFRRNWALHRFSPDETEWKRRAPLTMGHRWALWTSVYDQSQTDNCRFAMSLSRRGLPTNELHYYLEDGTIPVYQTQRMLGEYVSGEWVHDPGCNEDDRFWNPGYLFVDNQSPLIKWIITPLEG